MPDFSGSPLPHLTCSEQINNEDERLAGELVLSRFPVCKRGRDNKLTAAAYAHPGNALLPTGDKSIQRERNGLATIP